MWLAREKKKKNESYKSSIALKNNKPPKHNRRERERELLDAMYIDDIRLIIKFTIWAFLREHANMIAKHIHERQKYQRTHVYKSTLVRPSINIQHKFVSENFNHPFAL